MPQNVNNMDDTELLRELAGDFRTDDTGALRKIVAAARGILSVTDDTFAGWMANLPTSPPAESGKPWNNSGIPTLTP